MALHRSWTGCAALCLLAPCPPNALCLILLGTALGRPGTIHVLCSNYNIRMWFNGTVRGREGPPAILRVNQVRCRRCIWADLSA